MLPKNPPSSQTLGQSAEHASALVSGQHEVCLSNLFMQQSLHYYREREVLYLSNAKVACSTIKHALLVSMRENGHHKIPEGKIPYRIIHGKGPWWSNAYHKVDPEKTYTFSMARNPFARALSGYLNKIKSAGLIKAQFLIQNGLQPDQELSFTRFLRLIDPKNTILDQHWRPQVSNLLFGHVPMSEIFYLENFMEMSATLKNRLGAGLKIETRVKQLTSAPQYLSEHLTDEAIARIQTLYAEDFKVLGYSTDPRDVLEAPAKSIKFQPAMQPVSQSLEILGRVVSGQSGETLEQTLEPTTLAFFDKAMLRGHVRRGKVFDSDVFDTEVEVAAQTGSASEKYVANSIIAGRNPALSNPKTAENALRALISIAPAFVNNRARLIRLLLDQGRTKEASVIFEELKLTTIRQPLLDELRAVLGQSGV